MIDELPNLAIAWSIQAAGVLSPGPGVALILGVATAEGRAAGVRICLGIAAGALVLAVLTVIGLAAILAEIRGAMIAVKLLGAGYLLWLAIGAFRKAARPDARPDATPPAGGPDTPGAGIAPPARRRPAGDALRGFLFQIANPKAILFWLAVAAVGSLQAVSVAGLLVFLAGAFLISFAGHSGWALIFSSRPFRRLYTRARRGIEAALGTVFALAGVNLLTART